MNEEVQYVCATLAQSYRTLQEATEKLRKIVAAASAGADDTAVTSIREASKRVEEGGEERVPSTFLFFLKTRFRKHWWMCATQWPWHASWS